jgi:Tfp pilus assembly pilus retraction ATPase PilT
MAQKLILELVDGQQVEASLMESFKPDDGEIDILFEENGERCKLPLSEICCILFDDNFDQVAYSSDNDVSDNTESLEEVETVSGRHFQIRLIGELEFETGFYARSIDKHVPHKLIFFVFDGIILRSQHSRLCEILEKKGMIRSSDIQKTLKKQQSLKSRRVGEIISEQNKISINDVEAVIQRSYNSHTIPPNTRVGDILISEGLVTRKQVDEALANQQSGKKKKIGQLLVESGLVSEDQLLSALSTKFRMRFVTLENITPHRKALNALPGYLIRKLHIFPIEYTDDRLVVATSNPTDSSIPNITQENLENLKKILTKPYGILLCVGPTGSGKTTTLHSALDFINSPIQKIWTVEDPVEITQPGLRQVQVNPKAGYTFQEALRSFLRADPDVIMIGEMRDSETAQIAIQASLTGHFVLSTLHTNSAPETIVRLTEMGIDPLNFSDALLGIISQRLTLKLCDHCKKPYHPGYEEYTELVDGYGADWFKAHNMEDYTDDFTLMRKVGCDRCDSSGYKERIALHELLMGTEQTKTAIKKQYFADEIKNLSLAENMKSMKMDGIMKVFQGITDLKQVLKVCT